MDRARFATVPAVNRRINELVVEEPPPPPIAAFELCRGKGGTGVQKGDGEAVGGQTPQPLAPIAVAPAVSTPLPPTREHSSLSDTPNQSLPYSWTDSYLDETPNATRARWMQSKSFGPVVQSEGGGSSSSASTPYVYRNAEDVWGKRGGTGRGEIDITSGETGGCVMSYYATGAMRAQPLFSSEITASSVCVATVHQNHKPIVANRKSGSPSPPPPPPPSHASTSPSLSPPTSSTKKRGVAVVLTPDRASPIDSSTHTRGGCSSRSPPAMMSTTMAPSAFSSPPPPALSPKQMEGPSGVRSSLTLQQSRRPSEDAQRALKEMRNSNASPTLGNKGGARGRILVPIFEDEE